MFKFAAKRQAFRAVMWRKWAVEQAVKAGADAGNITLRAHEILYFVIKGSGDD